MRWLFFLMVAVNIGILIWGSTQKSISVTSTGGWPGEVGSLRLLSKADIEKFKLSELTDTDATEHSIENNVPDTLVVEPHTPADDDQAGIDVSGIVPGFNEDDPVGAESKSSIVAEDLSLVEDNAGPQELSESSEVEIDHRQAEQTQFNDPGLEIKPAQFCGTMGPIKDESLASLVLELFEKGAITASLRSEIRKKITGYWVVLPTYNDYPAAIEAIKSLRQLGIVDIQRFYRGELKDGVSLGIYNRRFNAEKRTAQIEEKGFSPEILPRHSNITEYWIDYRHQGAEEALSRIAIEYPKIEMTDSECPVETASDDEF